MLFSKVLGGIGGAVAFGVRAPPESYVARPLAEKSRVVLVWWLSNAGTGF